MAERRRIYRRRRSKADVTARPSCRVPSTRKIVVKESFGQCFFNKGCCFALAKLHPFLTCLATNIFQALRGDVLCTIYDALTVFSANLLTKLRELATLLH